MSEFWAGVSLACRRFPRIVALAVMMSIASATMALLLGDVLTQVAVLRGGATLREQQATIFTTFYGKVGVAGLSDEATKDLGKSVDSGRAYTAIFNNVEIENPDFAEGLPVVILVGDLADRLYPDLRLCAPAPCAMRGQGLRERDLLPLELAGAQLHANSVLPTGSTLFDPSAPGLDLRDSVVIRLSGKQLLKLDPIEREEAATRTVFVGVDDGAVADFAELAQATDLYLVPQNVAIAQPQRFREIMIMSAVYVVGLVSFLGLVLLAFALTAEQTLRAEWRGFIIRLMYGAPSSLVLLRTSGYLATVLLALPVPLLVLMSTIGPPVSYGSGAMLALLFLLYFVLLVRTVRIVARFDRQKSGIES